MAGLLLVRPERIAVSDDSKAVGLVCLLILHGASSLAEHPTVRHGKINEEDGREENPARGDMKS
jgi:hypothetical protein